MIIYSISHGPMNGIVYVGKTVKTLLWRKNRHLRELRRNSHCNSHLQRAYNLYGEPAFEFDVIEEYDSSEELNRAETFWISYLKFLGVKLYNLTGGGDSPFVSEETKAKISAALKGRKLSEERCVQISASLVGRAPTFKGRRHSPESKQKITNSKMGHPVSEETRSKLRAKNLGRKFTWSPAAKARKAEKQKLQDELELLRAFPKIISFMRREKSLLSQA